MLQQAVVDSLPYAVLYIPGVNCSRLSESHRKLRAALYFNYSKAGERVDLRIRNQFITLCNTERVLTTEICTGCIL